MAVYKATYCYPYLNTLDIRVAATDPAAVPAEFLGCKIDTSNSPITGYSIRLLDDNGKQIFPVQAEHISPISELQSLSNYEEGGTNSGLNGTQLKIPFFQNKDTKMLESYNAIYYQPRYLVDHVLMDSQFAQTLNYSPSMYELAGPTADGTNRTDSLWLWGGTESSGDQYLHFDWSTARDRDSNTVFNKIVLDGETLMVGETVLILIGSKNPNEITSSDKLRGEQKYSGLWVVAQRYNESENAYELILKPIKGFNSTEGLQNTGRLNTNEMAALKKGDLLHNCVFRYIALDGENDSGYFRPVSADGLWVDYAKNPIPNLQVDGRFFKWEITLYQGNPTPVSVEDGPSYITYSNIYEDWMDITVSSGTILGSCSERVQIANMEPSPGLDDQVMLPTSTDGAIVLQGKYMDLTYIPSGGKIDVFHGTRVNVKNYDASYGHVYPAVGGLDANVVDQSTHCQFFKHSNNPNDILETDKVKWSFNAEDSNPMIIYNKDISTSFLVLDNSHYSVSKMSDGDFFLYASVSHRGRGGAERYGVYQYVYNSTGIKYGGNTYHYFCRRAASYTTWAAYIGKIIFCEQGDFANQNIECLAQPGTYTLWNPTASTSGDSPLFFAHERPILLFPQSLTQTVKLIGVNDDWAYPSDGTSSTWTQTQDNRCYIDGCVPEIGDIVIVSSSDASKAYIYAEVMSYVYNDGGDTPQTIIGFKRRDDLGEMVEVGSIIYTVNGSYFGGHVVKHVVDTDNNHSLDYDWSLYTAVILKNSLTQTYITPFINMKEGMMLKLNGGQTVTYNRGSSGTVHSPKYMMIGQGSGDTEVNVETLTSSWIKILQYNKTVSCIRHNQLNCSSNGVVLRPDGTQGLASSGSTDSGFPWTYEVRSHFTTSNENSFCAFEQPYIRLYKNGKEYTGLSLGNAYDFDVLENLNDVVYEDMYVRDDEDSATADSRFGFVYAYDESTVSSRSIHLTGEYKQFNQISWESYRWLLLDDEGNILQDTGNKYNGTIDVTFFGLGNETNNTKSYYAVLFVTDDQNNTLRYVIKLNVGQVLQRTTALPFTAEFDCQTHSVLLNYEDAGIVSPTYLQGNNYQIYDDKNISADSPWDGGLLYDGDKMYVTAPYNNLNRLVDYSAGSLLQGTDGTDLEHSKAIYYGVPYAVSTPRGVETVPVNYGSTMHLNDSSVGQFYFDTEVQLDDNFCGEILAIDIEKDANASLVNPDPVVNLDKDKPTHFDNYVRFGLRLPDNLSGIASGLHKADTLNANRTTIELFLLTDDDRKRSFTFGKSSGSGLYHWDHKGEALPNSVTSSDIKYYLQPQRFAGEKSLWNGDVEFFELSGMPYSKTEKFNTLQFYIKQSGGNYFGFFGKSLGNLNLLSWDDLFDIPAEDLYVNQEITFQTDSSKNPSQNPTKLSIDAPSYWVDDRKKMAMALDVGSNFHGIAGTSYEVFNAYYQEEGNSDMLSWPADKNAECNSYWNEGVAAVGMDNYPTSWGKITPTGDLMTISPMVAMPRHPTLLSNKNFRITAQIYNVEKLYEQVFDNKLVANYSYRSVDNTYIIGFDYTTTDENGQETTTSLARFYLQISIDN